MYRERTLSRISEGVLTAIIARSKGSQERQRVGSDEPDTMHRLLRDVSITVLMLLVPPAFGSGGGAGAGVR